MATRRNLEAYEARRLKAIKLFDRGFRQSEVAGQTQVSRQAVSQWVKAWRRGGEAAVARLPHKGRPPKLKPAQRQRLVALLSQGASACGFPDDRWNGPRLVRLVRDRFGVCLHPNYACQLLRTLGLR